MASEDLQTEAGRQLFADMKKDPGLQRTVLTNVGLLVRFIETLAAVRAIAEASEEGRRVELTLTKVGK